MASTIYDVAGMTCNHCVRSVESEVAKVAGVESVEVDLDGGTLTVSASRGAGDDAVIEAVAEAGYSARRASSEVSG